MTKKIVIIILALASFISVAWGVACIALFAAIQEGHYILSK